MNKKEVLTIITAILLGLIYLSQKPRLDAYNECYMKNYIKWGSCNELGGE